MMKGIIQQIEEYKAPDKPMTAEDMAKTLEVMDKEAERIRKDRLARIKRDTQHLVQRSKELGKEIPWLLAYYASTGQIWWTSQEQASEYSEWLRDETIAEKARRIGDKSFQIWLRNEYIKRKLDV